MFWDLKCTYLVSFRLECHLMSNLLAPFSFCTHMYQLT